MKPFKVWSPKSWVLSLAVLWLGWLSALGQPVVQTTPYTRGLLKTTSAPEARAVLGLDGAGIANGLSSNSFNIFNTIASNVVTACQFTYSGGTFSGTNGWLPSGDGAYPFVLRDVVYAMRSTPWLFTDSDVQNVINQAASCYGFDCATCIGVGLTTAGAHLSGFPNRDHTFEFVDLIYEHYRRTGSPTTFAQYGATVSNTFYGLPLSNHLVFFPNGNDGAYAMDIGWGFEDSALLSGSHLGASLLRYRGCQELEYLTRAAGHGTTFYTNEMAFIRTNLETTLYDASRHLFVSATTSGFDGTAIHFHDVLMSAYAVVLGAGRSSVLDAVAFQLQDLLDSGTFRNGMAKHIAPEEDWSDLFQPSPGLGVYQNGGRWPEFTDWVARAVRRVNQNAADNLMKELAGRYQTIATSLVPFEWENPIASSTNGAARYLDSACMPLGYWSTNSFQR